MDYQYRLFALNWFAQALELFPERETEIREAIDEVNEEAAE